MYWKHTPSLYKQHIFKIIIFVCNLIKSKQNGRKHNNWNVKANIFNGFMYSNFYWKWMGRDKCND